MIGSQSHARSAADDVAQSASPVDLADGTQAAVALSAAVGIPVNPSCTLSAGFEAPTNLRIAVSLTPSRCAIARLLRPSLFNNSMLRRRVADSRRRPRRQPSS